MNNTNEIMASAESTRLNDYIGLMLQGQVPFDDEAFKEATAEYRRVMGHGASTRQQVSLAVCLYLQNKSMRISEPNARNLGAWGSRNDVLNDIREFDRGRRPTTSRSVAQALVNLGGPPQEILQLAVTQGLDAAQKAMHAQLSREFERRAAAIQDLADKRVRAAEQDALAATEHKEAAQAQAQFLERKYEEALRSTVDLREQAAAEKSRAAELQVQVQSLTSTLAIERDRAAKLESDLLHVQDELAQTRMRIDELIRSHAQELRATSEQAQQRQESLSKTLEQLAKTNERLTNQEAQNTMDLARMGKQLQEQAEEHQKALLEACAQRDQALALAEERKLVLEAMEMLQKAIQAALQDLGARQEQGLSNHSESLKGLIAGESATIKALIGTQQQGEKKSR